MYRRPGCSVKCDVLIDTLTEQQTEKQPMCISDR